MYYEQKPKYKSTQNTASVSNKSYPSKSGNSEIRTRNINTNDGRQLLSGVDFSKEKHYTVQRSLIPSGKSFSHSIIPFFRAFSGTATERSNLPVSGTDTFNKGLIPRKTGGMFPDLLSADKKLHNITDAKAIMEHLRGKGFKSNPLRMAYESEVEGLKVLKDSLLEEQIPIETVAKTLHEERRNLGVKYKNMTPEPLKTYIYELNTIRYGDELGPTYEWLKDAGKTDMQIAESACRPNSDIDKLLEGFNLWLVKNCQIETVK